MVELYIVVLNSEIKKWAIDLLNLGESAGNYIE